MAFVPVSRRKDLKTSARARISVRLRIVIAVYISELRTAMNDADLCGMRGAV